MTETTVYIETFRGTVAPSDCDHLGHMNVQYYIRAISDGMYSIMIQLGLTPDEIRRRKIASTFFLMKTAPALKLL